MITKEEAIRRLGSALRNPGMEHVSVSKALGRTAWQDLCARHAFMPYDYSRFDGFAIHQADCGHENLTLTVVGERYAGDTGSVGWGSGQTVYLTTGARIPVGCGAVIKQESVTIVSRQIRLDELVRVGEGIGAKGQVMAAGERIVVRGEVMDSGHIEKLVMGGYSHLPVNGKLVVGVLITGSELSPLGRPLEEGKLYPSNGDYLVARLQECGIGTAGYSCAPDDSDQIMETLHGLAQVSDLVITTGGIGHGRKDLMRTVLDGIGAQRLFDRIDDRPCRNVIAARWRSALVVCLSGNTFAMKDGFETLIKPVLD